MFKKIKAFAPASIGNVSCGFDVLGLAVEQPGDVVEATFTTNKRVVINTIHGDKGLLPRETEKNTAGVAVIEFLKHIKSEQGIDLVLHKNLPLGSGLGSSAASAVAAVVAVNKLMDEPLTRIELLPFVMEAERIACGSAHADNAAPSLLGGLILVRQNDPLDVIAIPTPKELVCVLVHPHIEIKTRDARQVLKPTVSLIDGITQWANTAALVAGMMKSDYALIGRSLVDVVAEPMRAPLIPGFYTLKEAALHAGALGCGISGSGPTVFALCRGIESARKVSFAMEKSFQDIDLASDVFISPVNTLGAKIIGS